MKRMKLAWKNLGEQGEPQYYNRERRFLIEKSLDFWKLTRLNDYIGMFYRLKYAKQAAETLAELADKK